jgi:hypothetical protein
MSESEAADCGISDPEKIHSLYQELYLTDLKCEIKDQDLQLQLANQSFLAQENELAKV